MKESKCVITESINWAKSLQWINKYGTMDINSISLDECIFDQESLRSCVLNILWGLTYRIFLILVTAYFLCGTSNLSQLERFLFVFLVSYLLFKIYWCVPNFKLPLLQICKMQKDLLFQSVLLGFCSDKIAEFVILHIFLSVAWFFLAHSSTEVIILGSYMTILNLFVLSSKFQARELVFIGIAIAIIFYFFHTQREIYFTVYGDYIGKISAGRRKAEEEIQNKNMYVASVTHDLKNPLNCLLGTIDFLKESKSLNEIEKGMLTTASYSGQVHVFSYWEYSRCIKNRSR